MAKNNSLSKLKIKKAQQLMQQNKHQEAREIYQKICRKNRSDIESALALAMINGRLGLFKEAEIGCRDIIKIKPDHAMVWHLLGSALHCQGNISEAINSYNEAINIKPDFLEAYYLLANAYRESGNLTGAVDFYQKAILLKPDFMEVLANLGATLLELNQLDEAWSVLDKALTLQPDTVQVLCSMATVLMKKEKPDDALQYILRAEKINPSFYNVQYLLGSIHKALGNFDEAIKSYQNMLSRNSNDELVIAETALIYERQGKYQQAYKAIKPLLDTKTLNQSVILTYSRLSGKIDHLDNSINLMESILQNEQLNNAGAIDVHYELGRRYDKNSQYDNAFKHFQLANAKVRKSDAANVEKNIIKDYTSTSPAWLPSGKPDFFKKLPLSSNASQQPVFIVGMLRSGTTLTEQILSSHPDIQLAAELTGRPHIIAALNLDPLKINPYKIHQDLNTEKLNHIAGCYLDEIRKLPVQTARTVDSVRTDLEYLSIIARVFPKAHVIYISREPLDNCLSIYFQNLVSTHSKFSYATDLLEIGKFYIRQKNMMAYYKKVLDIDFIEIRYEDLATNIEETSKTMIEFCGLEWSDNCLSFHKTQRDISNPSYDQVRQPIYTKSIHRWKNYEQHIKPLIELLDKHKS